MRSREPWCDERVFFEFINKDLPLNCTPVEATKGAACFDLVASHDFAIRKGWVVKVGTNVKFQMPYGWAAFIHPRSGLASKGIQVHNGVIDSDYRKEVFVLMYVASENTFVESYRGSFNSFGSVEFKAGSRIAQIEFRKSDCFSLENYKVEDTDRGGFGSTGV